MVGAVALGAVDLVEPIAGIILLVILGLSHYRIDRKVSRTEKKATAIDKAVNSRPPDQPKLYDMVQTLDVKFDMAVKEIRDRSIQHEERDDERFDMMAGVLARVDGRADANRTFLEREVRRLDKRITETRDQIRPDREAHPPTVLEDGDTPYN